ncbi:hypothetical protein [Pelosinus sp. IPA-1]|uniref:hypothetical protein n=1 Tax=Pelosinus sp. IPA-1 TaxID=3029569 RepID=UPI00243616A1|nr:hypothetical protein [Pelosinus sp. IPA-1]GMB00951.1 hypothetical protein PIPA1_37500 [Pelosinus sp. IPA-1]
MFKKTIVFLFIILLLNMSLCLAASSDDNAMIAVALYIDTSGHYIPGTDFLNKALNEVIRFKINALFLGSEVQSGNAVLRDLTRCGITNTASATPDLLSTYASNAHVNYVMLFTIHPLDFSLDLKAFSSATNSYLVDKSITRPDGTEALSAVDTFSAMISDQLTEIFQTIHS